VEQAIHLLVLLIPTKESVYAKYLESDRALEKSPAIQSLLENERKVATIVRAFFEEHGIAHINLLPELQERVGGIQLYPGNFDGHPNQHGYRVIAENIERYLRQLTPDAIGGGVRGIPVHGSANGR
jgi:lysophospholipase L1-like esterase